MKRAILLFLFMIFFFIGNSQSKKSDLFDLSSIKISELKVNTIRSDFGPAIIGDSIFFTSFRDELIVKSDKELMEREFYDLYNARINDSGVVVSGRNPLGEFITRYHDGPVSWCPKTNELYVTQSNYVNPSVKYKAFRNEEIKLRIVVAKKNEGKWTLDEENEFRYNNADYSVGHPAINESGDTLFFTSDKPGGFGETDIYMSVRKKGKWNKPVNMGSKINTSGKDEFPFITGDSYSGRFLIFASTGHGSKGGFDLFYIKLSDPDGVVYPFPEPINTEYDDFAMNLPEYVEYGYMTSNRPGGTGNDDIYRLVFSKYLSYVQEILVLDSKSRKPIPGSLVNFCNRKNQKVEADGIASFSFDKNAICDVTASAFGYKDKSKLIKIGSHKQGTVLRDTIFLDMIVNEKIVLKNIYYDFDKWDILLESAKELDKLVALLKENPDMKVELGSHTDERVSVGYNMKLSQLRAQSAVNYIVSKGIDKSQITGKGYGKSQLINKSTAKIKLTPEQQRENRRTEVFIPGFYVGEPVKQVKGDFSDGKPDIKKGYSSIKEQGSILESSVNERAVSNSDNEIKFYVILGSFKENKGAVKLVQQLKTEGYNATIVDETKHFRVVIGYQNLSQAKNVLGDLKGKYKDALIRPKEN